MFLEQANEYTDPNDPREQRGYSKSADQPSDDWAGDPLEGSGFEGESPEEGFEWRE
jgi:hypothetical protein